ncbi:peptidoglycan-binding domain-containing protein [Allocoleopsis franciscana]|uniref:Putative peptidoglycan-binding domain-containing protein n=1 Tax=Allocoleopsis franciscana PCC 7113 TaxID=1173027 RepID=K9WFN2_9CYAN|nr:peptidoglycan-binding protein [Allocoleopsis franciscana]AFZ19220.1 putative peptidoglycan-binding domain-containing protein [Allocoleopsis franciscana PCC 7113]
METLAYLHLALANEEPTETDYGDLTASWESLKQLSRGTIHQVWNQPKFSRCAAVSLLSFSIALGVVGMANQAFAAVQEGDQGAEVTTVQQRLQELGYFKANITGYFGTLTKDAVIQFQQAQGLAPDGIVGTNTLAALGEQSKPGAKLVRQLNSQPLPKPKPVRVSTTRNLRLGDRGSQVSALQESLAIAGFPGGANGIFDEATQKAVIRFQQAKGLAPDGIVGPQTLAALPVIGGPNPSSSRRNPSNRSKPSTTTTRTTSRDSTNRSKPSTTTTRSTSRNSTNRTTPSTTTTRSTSRNSTNRSKPSTTTNRQTPKTTTSRLNTANTNLSNSTTLALQKRLQELGFYRGEIDGIWGPQTQAAVEAAQRSYDVSAADLEKRQPN